MTALAISWPWLAAAGLVTSLAFLPATLVQRAWVLPLVTNFAIPILVLILLLVGGGIMREAWATQPCTLRDTAPAE
jgi:hypothetical protein